jgi:replicative DNA helicase
MKNHDPILEAKVLGAIFHAPTLFSQASHLSRDAYYDGAHAIVWDAINNCIDKGFPITPSSVALNNSSRVNSIGGISFLDQLASQGGDIISNYPPAIDKIREMHQWRQISDISARLASAADSRDKTPDDILSGILRFTEAIMTNGKDTSRTKQEVAKSAIARAKEQQENVTTGIDTIDYLMQGGLQSRRLYGLGGLYGRGKTIMLGSVSDNLGLQGEPHLFISMETEPEDIEIRNCSKHINANASILFDHDDPDHKDIIDRAEKIIPDLADNTFFEFAPGGSMNEIHRMILRAKTRHNIRGFILDYWQLIRGREKGQSEDGHLGDCADRLAAICRQENLWGIVTAQVDERGNLIKSQHLLRSAALYMRLQREEDAQAAYFVTEKSNYTRYADTGNESVPGMVFDMASGPHFRNTNEMDLPEIAQEEAGAFKV